MDNRIEKARELLKDEKIVKELLMIEKAEDAQEYLEDHGVVMTLDEVKNVGEVINKAQRGEITEEQISRAANGELTEEELEMIAGGDAICAVVGTAMLLVVGFMITTEILKYYGIIDW